MPVSENFGDVTKLKANQKQRQKCSKARLNYSNNKATKKYQESLKSDSKWTPNFRPLGIGLRSTKSLRTRISIFSEEK